jgi:hypothetical protein
MLADSEHRGPQCIGWVTFRVRCVFSKRSSTWPSALRFSLAGADAGYERQPFLFARAASSINVACEKSHDRSVLPLHVDAGMLFAAHKTRRSGVIATDRRPEQRWSMLWRNRGKSNASRVSIRNSEAPHPSKTRNLVRSRAPHPKEKYVWRWGRIF